MSDLGRIFWAAVLVAALIFGGTVEGSPENGGSEPGPEIGTALVCENVQGEAVCFEIGE